MNYICKGRSNYFQVTDEARYKVLFECILGEKKDDFTKEVDGKILHGFSISNYIDFALPASENETVKECIARGETLYDEFGDEVPVSDYDKQDALYNSDGKRVFRRAAWRRKGKQPLRCDHKKRFKSDAKSSLMTDTVHEHT